MKFLVVPPNGPVYADIDVLKRLDAYIRRCFPDHEIEVAKIVQPRIADFTIVPAFPTISKPCDGPAVFEQFKENLMEEIDAALKEFAESELKLRFN